jgi:CheY-like chemotaxis protein
MANSVPRPKILVAEDDAALRRLLELRLDVDGYDVMSVADGNDALAAVKEWGPNVLICDVMMPRLSGLTVCRELRADPAYAHLPIILLTARVFDADIEEVVALGEITFVGKPFNAAKLNQALSEILENQAVALRATPSSTDFAWLNVGSRAAEHKHSQT